MTRSFLGFIFFPSKYDWDSIAASISGNVCLRELVMYQNRADRDLSATYGGFARALVTNRHLSVLKLQREDEPAHFHDPVAAAKLLQVLSSNFSLIDVQGISQDPDLRRILKRNRILKEKARSASVMLLVAKKYDKNCEFSRWPKDLVLMLAKQLFDTYGDPAWQ